MKVLIILLFAVASYQTIPSDTGKEFFKIEAPAAVVQTERVETKVAEQKPVKQAEVQPPAPQPEPAPNPPPVVCGENQWVRADGGGCLDKPAPAPAPVAVATPHVPVTTVTRGSGNCDLAYGYNWPANTARAICMAESGGNAGAANFNDHHGSCSGSYSLMQVGCFWYPYYGYGADSYYDGHANMKIAYEIYKRQGGFGAWTTYTSGKYAKYL